MPVFVLPFVALLLYAVVWVVVDDDIAVGCVGICCVGVVLFGNVGIICVIGGVRCVGDVGVVSVFYVFDVIIRAFDIVSCVSAGCVDFAVNLAGCVYVVSCGTVIFDVAYGYADNVVATAVLVISYVVDCAGVSVIAGCVGFVGVVVGVGGVCVFWYCLT